MGKGINKGSKEMEIESCVNCPIANAYVPVEGNCLDIDMITDYNKIGNDAVKLPGKGEETLYTAKTKCSFARGVTTGIRTGILKGVMCTYNDHP